jgi:hypothetical protein
MLLLGTYDDTILSTSTLHALETAMPQPQSNRVNSPINLWKLLLLKSATQVANHLLHDKDPVKASEQRDILRWLWTNQNSLATLEPENLISQWSPYNHLTHGQCIDKTSPFPILDVILTTANQLTNPTPSAPPHSSPPLPPDNIIIIIIIIIIR